MSQRRCLAESISPSIEPLTSSVMTRSRSRRASACGGIGSRVEAGCTQRGEHGEAGSENCSLAIVVSVLVTLSAMLAAPAEGLKTRNGKDLRGESTRA